MSSKTSTYFPSYQLRVNGKSLRPGEVWFRHNDGYFVAKMPMFGATDTQKAALRWAAWNTPPVISVSHEKPGSPDIISFGDNGDLHRRYTPYAMVIATIECLGEAMPRKVKIYFCDVERYEDNCRIRTKETYIELVA